MDFQEKTERCQQILLHFLTRRSAGEGLEPATFSARYPELMPELEEMLRGGVKMLREVVSADQPPAHIRGYAFKREINRGGQGCVFEAIQESTGQRVAIKMVRPLTRHSLARFEREIAALSSIKHPGVVGIIDCGRMGDGTFYLVMEFVDGQNFDAWIDTCKRESKPQAEISATFIAICEAVAAAHRLGIVHRDLKPSNIRIDTEGRPRIIDFGLASLRDDLSEYSVTRTGNIVGTLLWASPEQVSGASSDVTPASDVYSLGVLFYQAIAGRFPYEVHGSVHETIKAICDSKPRSVRSVKNPPFGEVPPFLDAIISRCLQKDPDQRPADAAVLSVALIDARVPVRMFVDHFKRVGSLAVAIMAIALTVIGGWAAVRPETGSAVELMQPLPVYQNKIGMRFRKVPAGWYHIGSSINEQGRRNDERQQSVELRPGLWMAETEVTVDQFKQVMPSPAGTSSIAQLPIDSVSWEDAQIFCRRLSGLDGQRYRLPTEPEWEVCCRAGTVTPYAIDRPADSLWFKERAEASLHAVATSTPNAWGLFDFHGNVAEWTASTRYGSTVLLTTSPDAFGDGLFRIVRGGSYLSELSDCRSASRDSANAYLRQPGIGFRVALDK